MFHLDLLWHHRAAVRSGQSRESRSLCAPRLELHSDVPVCFCASTAPRCMGPGCDCGSLSSFGSCHIEAVAHSCSVASDSVFLSDVRGDIARQSRSALFLVSDTSKMGILFHHGLCLLE